MDFSSLPTLNAPSNAPPPAPASSDPSDYIRALTWSLLAPQSAQPSAPPAQQGVVPTTGEPNHYLFDDPFSVAARSVIQSNSLTEAAAQGIREAAGYGSYGLGAVARAAGMPGIAAPLEAGGERLINSPITPELQATEARPWFGGGVGGFLGKGAVTLATMAPFIAGGAAAGLRGAAELMVPSAVGGIEQSAAQKPGGATAADAARALALGLPLGAIQSYVPAGVPGVGALARGFWSRTALSGIVGAGANALGGGLQAAAEMSVRPDLSPADKSRIIVNSVADNAIAGGLVGGVMGGVFGHAASRGSGGVSETLPTSAEMAQQADMALGRQPTTAAAPAAAPAAPNALGGAIARAAGVTISERPELENLQATTMPGAIKELTPQLSGMPPEHAAAIQGVLDRYQSSNAAAAATAKEGAQAQMPPVDYVKSAINLQVGPKTKGSFADFIRGTDATNPVELWQAAQKEIASNDGAGSRVTKTQSFTKLMGALEDRADVKALKAPQVEGGGNAIQEPSTTGMDVRGTPANGEAVGGGHPEGNAAAQEAAPGPARPVEERLQEAQARVSVGVDPDAALATGQRLAEAGTGVVDKLTDVTAAQSRRGEDERAVDMAAAPIPDETDITPRPGDIPRFLHMNVDEQEAQPVVPPAVEPRVSGTSNQPSLGADVIRSTLTQIAQKAGLRSDVAQRVHVIDDASQLPPDVLTAAAVASARDPTFSLNAMPAFYHNGHAYFQAPQIRSRAQLEGLFAHEVFGGHMGTAARFGEAGTDSHTNAMADVFDRAGGYEGLRDLARRMGVWEGKPDAAGVEGIGVRGYLPAAGFRMTPADKSRAVEELVAHAAEQTGRMKLGMLSVVGRIKQAFASKFRDAGMPFFARAFEQYSPADVAKFISDNRRALQVGAPPVPVQGIPQIQARRVDSQNEAVRRVEGALANVQSHLNNAPTNLAMSFPKSLLSLRSLVRNSADILPSMGKAEKLYDNHMGLVAKVAHDNAVLQLAQDKYRAQSPKAAALLNEIMRLTTVYGIDISKPFRDHQHLLLDADGKPLSDAAIAEHQKAYDAVVGGYNKLGQNYAGATPGVGQQIYRDGISIGRAQSYGDMAAWMHSIVDGHFSESRIPGFEIAPGEVFRAGYEPGRGAQAFEQFWRDEFQSRFNALWNWVSSQQADAIVAGKKPPSTLAPLNELITAFRGRLGAMATHPYFYMGREGDQYVALTLRADQDGRPDPAAVAELRRRMDKAGFDDVALDQFSTDKPTVYMRFKGMADAQSMWELAQQAQNDGLLSMDKLPHAGMVGGSDQVLKMAYPALSRLLALEEQRGAFEPPDGASVKVQDAFRAAAAAHQDQLRQLVTALLPKSNIRQSWLSRETVLGASTDMFSNNVIRGQRFAQTAAGLTYNNDLARADAEIQQQVRAAKANGPYAGRLAQQYADAYSYLRALTIANNVPAWVNKATNFFHVWQLGLSGSYVMMQLAQVPMFGLPELAKKFSFAASSAAMLRVQPKVTKVIGIMTGDWLAGKNVSLNESILRRAGFSAPQIEAVMQQVNRGQIEAQTFAQQQVGSALRRWQQKMIMPATLSEVYGRLTMTLAADALARAHPERIGAVDRHSYTQNVIGESMFKWARYNTAAAFRGNGPLGNFAPLQLKFMQFESESWAKILFEYSKAVGLRGGPGARREAARYMAAQMAMQTVLGGTLGMGIVPLVLGMYQKFSDLTNGGEGTNVLADYRNFLGDTFGPAMGEVIAHGLPWRLGFNASDWGMSSLPLTDFLADRQSIGAALADQVGRMAGSPASIMTNLFQGGVMMSQGRVPEGLSKMLPKFASNLVNAYRISADGNHYESVNTGKPLEGPDGELLTASDMDILKTALGIEPGAKARAQEAQEIISSQNTAMEARSQMLQTRLRVAQQRGDQAMYDSTMQAIHAFDQMPENQGRQIAMQLPQLMRQWALQRGAAGAAGAWGVPLRGVGEARQILRFEPTQ